MGMAALPLAVSVFTASPAQAAAVIDPTGDPTDIYSTQAGFVLPWLVGMQGVGGSMGTLGGWAWAHSGPTGTQAGVKGILQQSTHIGPAYFHLNVIKSAVFTYTPATTTTTTTPGGPCDEHGHPITTTTTAGPRAELNLVDNGKWAAGIPGFIEWYGELGFTSDTVVDENGISFNWKGINKQYVSIGGGLLAFGFDFQPSFAFHVPTPGVNLAAPLAPVLAPGSAPAGAKSGDEGAKPGDGGATPGDGGATHGDGFHSTGYDGGKPGQDFDQPQSAAENPDSGEAASGDGGGQPIGGNQPGAGGEQPGHDDDNPKDGEKPGDDGGVNPQNGEKPGKGGDNDKPQNGEKPGKGGDSDKPRAGDRPGQSNHDKSGQDGPKSGPGGDGSNKGGDKAGADTK